MGHLGKRYFSEFGGFFFVSIWLLTHWILLLIFCRFWVHLCMAYAITFWTCFILKREYQNIALMRLQFLANDQRRPNQFTVMKL